MKTLLYKIIYAPLINQILRNLFYPLGKISGKALLSVSGKLKVNFDHHTFFLHTNQTCHVTQVLFFDGPKRYEFTLIFAHLIKQSTVFLDIGSNIGYFSILGGKLQPNATIIAVEPSKGALHYLERNIKENKLESIVTPVGKAISNTNEPLDFHVINNSKYPWIEHNLNGSNSLQKVYGKQKNETYKVDCITISKLMSSYNLQTIDLIKLDTECTEHLILNSAVEEVNIYRPIIVCEVYDIIKSEIQKCLNQFNQYELYQIIDDSLLLCGSIEKSKPNEFNYLFSPTEKRHLIQKFIQNA
jgi:FkbM family methyltransferase